MPSGDLILKLGVNFSYSDYSKPAKISIAMSPNPIGREGLPPELDLILCCARARLNDATAERVRLLLRGKLNWPEVLECANQHNMLLVLYERLRGLDAVSLMQDQQETLTDLARNMGRNNLAFLDEMLRLHGVFETEQIPAIPYKGPVLAWLAYHDFALRNYTDLDFILPQRFVPKAMSLLQTAGYDAQFDVREAQAGRRHPAPGEYAFVRGPNFMRVELHTERTLRYFPGPLNLDAIHARLILVEIAGRKVRTFSVEDTLVMLCVHGAKHFWERLALILDVAKLVAAQPVDWPLAMCIAAEMRCSRLLLLGLYLAHDLSGAALPPDILEKARSDRNVRWLAGKVREQIEGTSDPSSGVLRRAAFRIRSRDALGEGVWHLLHLATRPTETDRDTFRLPKALRPFYALARPWRLLREYGFGFRRRVRPEGETSTAARPPLVLPRSDETEK
jgi:hypothetical protein